MMMLYQSLVEATLLLSSLVNKRQIELSNPSQREALIDALTTLRKSVPLLNGAMNTYITYPENAQARVCYLL